MSYSEIQQNEQRCLGLLNPPLFFLPSSNEKEKGKLYLSDHSQQVQYRGADGQLVCSDSLPITMGVYQGTALGPILFSIFCNDLVLHASDATIIQYADDVQIAVRGKKSHLPELIATMENHLVLSLTGSALTG